MERGARSTSTPPGGVRTACRSLGRRRDATTGISSPFPAGACTGAICSRCSTIRGPGTAKATRKSGWTARVSVAFRYGRRGLLQRFMGSGRPVPHAFRRGAAGGSCQLPGIQLLFPHTQSRRHSLRTGTEIRHGDAGVARRPRGLCHDGLLVRRRLLERGRRIGNRRGPQGMARPGPKIRRTSAWREPSNSKTSPFRAKATV